MRLDQAKGRSIQKYLDTSLKHCILVQFKGRSSEKTAMLPNTVNHNRSLLHTARLLH